MIDDDDDQQAFGSVGYAACLRLRLTRVECGSLAKVRCRNGPLLAVTFPLALVRADYLANVTDYRERTRRARCDSLLV